MNDCDIILEYRDCGAVIAISDVDDHTVVAFRGTFETTQLAEQVLRYNENTHDSLYPCIKSIIEEQIHDNPSLRDSVTGHSLGGAQASLIAAHLLYDNVVSPSKLELYTFGAPRVGDRDFAYEFDRLVGNSWRITKKNDPVVQSVPSYVLGLYFAYHTRTQGEKCFTTQEVTSLQRQTTPSAEEMRTNYVCDHNLCVLPPHV